jgi:RNA polymerase sigma-70 factor (ECF subfamily)
VANLTAAQFTAQLRAYAVGVAYHITRDPDVAEDLAHDALVKAWAGRARFNRRAQLTTWVYRIVVNECLMKLRRDRRPSAVNLLADPAATPEPVDPASPVDARLDAARRWWAATVGLPDADREALAGQLGGVRPRVLHAEHPAGLTVKGVMSRVRRARLITRTRLVEEECDG